MLHYKMMQSDPSVYILAKNPRTGSLEETKVYKNRGKNGEDVVYLQNKQNFAFKFFNPLQEKIGAKITMNGKSDENILIINPGESISLDRFLNVSKKMVFETYNVDGNNQQAMNAIEKNGVIEIEFFKENDYYYNFNYPFVISGTTTGGYVGQTYTSDNTNTPIHQYMQYDTSNQISCINNYNSIETGRIEKGEHSTQQLETEDIYFEVVPFLIKKIKLLPIPHSKNNEHNKIRNYCTDCGYRLRKESWMFCPKCGTKI